MHSGDQENIPISDDVPERVERAVDPGLRQLADDKKHGIIRENLRNGRKAQAKKKQARDDYADAIRITEGRDVRAYKHSPTDARRKAQKAASKANRSPEQKQKEDDAIADHQWCERRRAKGIAEAVIQAALVIRAEEREAKRAKAAAAEAELASNPNFGKF